MEIDWTADDVGRLLGVSVHDGRLDRLDWDNPDYLRIIVNASVGAVVIALGGLELVTLQQVWNGAIMSDIYAWPIVSVPEAAWMLDDGVWRVLLSGRAQPDDQRKLAEQMMRRKPAALVVQFEFSYGGAIAAVCDRMSVSVVS